MLDLACRAFYWCRHNLFNSWFNTAVTLVIVWLLYQLVPQLVSWIFVDSLFGPGDAKTCRTYQGACWSFIYEKFHLILLGRYPYDERWRPLLAIFILLAMLGISCWRRLWQRYLLPLWIAAGMLIISVMSGGIFGLPEVESLLWGGLPLTLLLSVTGIAFAFPLSILLAVGRRSVQLPLVRFVCASFVELARSVPLVALLFVAVFMLPLLLPQQQQLIDRLWLVQSAFVCQAAAALAEVIRGGLQGLPHGQYQAADALGLSYWSKMRLVALPQALSSVIPALVNVFILMFKETSLVVVVSMFDLLGSTKSALSDPFWQGFYREAYLFAGIIYFCFCCFMSQYSRWLEGYLSAGRR